MERIAFLLHIYQPVTQDEKTFRKVAESSYVPLINLIKKRKDFKFTFDIPLSLLEQMDKYGYSNWITDLKGLVAEGVIEVVGSGAYHPLLTKLKKPVAEEQIILNEYGLGFYLGRRSGFEGEPAIMIRDLRGFFPPEMAINADLVALLDELGYSWVVADTHSLGEGYKPGVYSVEDHDIALILRNEKVSNILSFKRDNDVGDIVQAVGSLGGGVIALDGEFFGHHHQDGIYLFGKLLEKLTESGIKIVSVNEYFESESSESKNHLIKLGDIRESSWGMGSSAGDIYPYWEADNNLNKALWKVFNTTQDLYRSFNELNFEDFENKAIWNEEAINEITEVEHANEIRTKVLFHKCLHSDQFWWSSRNELMGTLLFDTKMISRALNIYEDYADVAQADELLSIIEEARSIMTNNEDS